MKPQVTHLSDSLIQREVEPLLRLLLSEQLRVTLSPERLSIGGGSYVQVDAANLQERILCEIYSRIGKPLPAQKKKIASDMLKLTIAEEAMGGSWRKILCFADKAVAAAVLGDSWMARAATMREFDVRIMDVPPSVRGELLAAQRRQTMVNGGAHEG